MKKQVKTKKVKVERRRANYSLLEACKAFKSGNPDTDMDGTSGNIQRVLFPYNPDNDYDALYLRVTAPMLLARLCAAFAGLKIHVGGQADYKTTWEVALKHKYGAIITFYDYMVAVWEK